MEYKPEKAEGRGEHTPHTSGKRLDGEQAAARGACLHRRLSLTLVALLACAGLAQTSPLTEEVHEEQQPWLGDHALGM